MSTQLVSKSYRGEKLDLHFATDVTKGEIVVTADSITSPNGDKGVGYNCYLLAAGRWLTQGMDEAEFISDITKVISLIADQPLPRDVNKVADSLLKEHINQNGRLIDSDLCTYISEVFLGLNAFSEKETGKSLSLKWRDKLLEMMFTYAEQHFASYLYITQYRRTPFGLQPILVNFKEFKNRQYER